jgi:YidC/Oxa1 family membrane protein insertase
MSVLSMLDPAVGLAHNTVATLSHVIPTAAAIILFTVCVRLLLHPMARAAARGDQARTRLAPQVAEIRRRHSNDLPRMQQAMSDLYRDEGSSPFAGCLPMLVQLPFFSVMYRLFTRPTIAGAPNDLLHRTLFGAPLGSHLANASAAQLPVFLGLCALLTAVALITFRRARRTTPTPAADLTGQAARVAALAPYLSFGTVLFATLVPLAAGVYLLTSTAWTTAERALLYRTSRTAGAVPADRPASASGKAA